MKDLFYYQESYEQGYKYCRIDDAKAFSFFKETEKYGLFDDSDSVEDGFEKDDYNYLKEVIFLDSIESSVKASLNFLNRGNKRSLYIIALNLFKNASVKFHAKKRPLNRNLENDKGYKAMYHALPIFQKLNSEMADFETNVILFRGKTDDGNVEAAKMLQKMRFDFKCPQ